MEIERKFLIDNDNLPDNLNEYPHDELEQAYIITDPVLRIRRKNDEYILTYKGAGLMSRQEIEMPLTKDSYETLLSKTEGVIISKTRYRIPEQDNLTIELDIFHDAFQGLLLAEVEFPSEEAALAYSAPAWFNREVTMETTFHNSTLSCMDSTSIQHLLENL